MFNVIERPLKPDEIRQLLVERREGDVVHLNRRLATGAEAPHMESLDWILKEDHGYHALSLTFEGRPVSFGEAASMAIALAPDLYVYTGPKTAF